MCARFSSARLRWVGRWNNRRLRGWSVRRRGCYGSLVDIVRQMQTIARTHGIDLFVVLAPDEIQVEPRLRTEVSRTFALDPANYDYAALPADLTRDLDAAGVATLNLQSAFEARGMTEALYAKDDTHDTHWNEAGNAVAADAIWAFLRTRMGVR
jgi:hypothetical protein